MGISHALIGLFGQSSFAVVNINMARKIGIEATMLYSCLLNKFRYFEETEKLIKKDGKQWFFSTIEDMEYSTTLNRKKQEKAIETLINIGLIEKIKFGIPSKRYFHIVDTADVIDKVLDIVGQPIRQTRLSKMDNSCCPKQTIADVQNGQQKIIYINNNKNNKYIYTKNEVEGQTREGENTLLNNNEPNSSTETKSNGNSHIAKKEKECSDVPTAKTKRQKNNIPPTIEEVKQYVEQRIRDGDTIYRDVDVNYFYDYYQSSNWHYKDGKPVKFWRMCLATWVRNIGRYGGKEQVKKQEPIQERAPRKYQYVETDENTLVNGMTRAEYEKLYRPFEPFT